MPLPVIADVARVALLGQHVPTGLNTVNVIHVQRASSGTAWGDVATNITNRLKSAECLEMYGCCQTTFALYEMHLTPLDGSSVTIVRTPGDDVWPVGHVGGDAIPQVCGLLKLVTDVRGRRGRGRVYLGPVGEAGQSSGLLDSAVQEAVTGAWDAFANALIAGTASAALGVASYRGRVWHQATNIACESRTATQRRRNHR